MTTTAPFANATTDPGRHLFERLMREGWALVDEWLANKEAETLHLEFKRKANPSTATIDEGDKPALAKTLSALANVEGGLLVFGIQAGGGSRDSFDRVEKIVPLSAIEGFGGVLDRRLDSFTDPPIAGLRVHTVENPATPRSGVVGVYVPPSLGSPHRATNASSDVNDRYYMRTTAGALPMPHSLLGALFAYTSPPRLELRLRFSKFTRDGHVPYVELRLVNRGRAAARRPAVHIYDPPALQWPQHRSELGDFRLKRERTETGKYYISIEAHPDIVIYPHSERALLEVACEQQTLSGIGDIALKFHAKLFSLETNPVEGEAVLSADGADPDDIVKARRAVIGQR